jgi:hypothetical protein
MLEPDQWEDVLSKVTGTVYRGTERISSNSSNALLNLLKVGPDPVIRQKVAKRLVAQGYLMSSISPGGIPTFRLNAERVQESRRFLAASPERQKDP